MYKLNKLGADRKPRNTGEWTMSVLQWDATYQMDKRLKDLLI